ncbi:hypothetical protein M5D96_014080 [Drosophila gunungcola]|uniref:Uncharacterized protein n=1 Tax=Drosophila gunungcola TaxID=103775 RepID=A0A9P9YAN6_9MUSC|nr:hypothetical protein M5D96_014080 [Drosophila gunungcola]
MFFSLAACFGTLFMYASFNDFNKIVHKFDNFHLGWLYNLWNFGNLAHETKYLNGRLVCNKASKLRSKGKVKKPAPIGPSWALTSTRYQSQSHPDHPQTQINPDQSHTYPQACR